MSGSSSLDSEGGILIWKQEDDLTVVDNDKIETTIKNNLGHMASQVMKNVLFTTMCSKKCFEENEMNLL